MSADLLTTTAAGLYCPAGDFHIDPWQAVPRAVLTHAHADHARVGSQRYLAADTGRHVLRLRLGADAELQFQPLGQPLRIHGVTVTFFPAGHILGSAQIRIEHAGKTLVVSGDYKRDRDPTCQPCEPVRCHTFVTESTFGLPVYRWPDSEDVMADINRWWRNNQARGRASLLLAWSLGKAQRLLAGLDSHTGPILTHGAVETLNAAYRAAGIALPETTWVGQAPADTDWSQTLIIAPPSAAGSPWVRRFGDIGTGMASGWMQIRGNRRRRAVDRGFVLSDHVDWQGLLQTIRETEASEVWVTHGYSAAVVRYLRESGLNARIVETEFGGEPVDEVAEESSDMESSHE
jgi:putative mRNA 3-end processing factor